MTVTLATAVRRRRWLRWLAGLGAVAALAAAASAFTLWRPLTVFYAATRGRLFLAGVQDGTALAGPYRIHYLVAGSGRPVLLLHGLGGNALQWGNYIPALAKEARVYAPDILGYGRSAKPDVDYSMELQTETIRGFLDAMNVRKADIVGLSMGGWLAADFARRYPDRVRRLVLVAAGGLTFDPSRPLPFIPRDANEIQRFEQLLGSRKPIIPAIAAKGAVREMQRDRWVVDRFLERRKAGLDFLDGKLGTVTMPTLLLWGDKDLLSPLSQAQDYQRQIQLSHLVVLQGCGHAALMDCRSYAQPEIVSFLSAANPPRGSTKEIAVP